MDETKTAFDIKFLLERSMQAGRLFGMSPGGRDIGQSSNSIVAIAYGVNRLEDQVLPSDAADMMACERMWEKLPAHRKTEDAITAMERARAVLNNRR